MITMMIVMIIMMIVTKGAEHGSGDPGGNPSLLLRGCFLTIIIIVTIIIITIVFTIIIIITIIFTITLLTCDDLCAAVGTNCRHWLGSKQTGKKSEMVIMFIMRILT